MSFSQKLEYNATVKWDGETGGTVSCENCEELTVDIPKEHGGLGRSACPDQLFLAALGGCLLNTFIHFATRFKADFRDVQVHVNAKLELTPEGYRFTEASSVITVYADEEDTMMAERCADLAVEYCHITRSIEEAINLKVSHRIVAKDI